MLSEAEMELRSAEASYELVRPNLLLQKLRGVKRQKTKLMHRGQKEPRVGNGVRGDDK
jgi:hypothetical protein